MIFQLQYGLKSDMIETKTTIITSENLDSLINMTETRNNNGEWWTILANRDVFKVVYKKSYKKEDLSINNGWFTVADSLIERNELTAQIKANTTYKAKEIDLIRTDFLKAYDIKKLKPTIIKR